MEAKQNGGIHSNAGCFNHSKQYAPNKKKLAAVNNEDPMYKVCEYKNQKRMIERNVKFNENEQKMFTRRLNRSTMFKNHKLAII